MSTLDPIGEVLPVNRDAVAGDQVGAKVVMLTGGGFVICWTDRGVPEDGAKSCIRTQVYDEDGNPVGDERLLGGGDEWDRYDPAIAATADGGFAVSWTVGDASVRDYPSWISLQGFDALGAPVDKGMVVTDQNGAGDSSITILDDGRFIVGWTDPGDDGGDVHSRTFAVNSKRHGTVGYPGDHAAGLQASLVTARLDGGGYVAVWANNGDEDGDDDGFGIQAALFGAKGEARGEPIQINLGTRFDQADPQVAATRDGFVVVWADRGGADAGAIHARFFDLDGKPLGDDVEIARELHDLDVAPVVAVDADGRVLIAFTSGGVVSAQLFGADGSALGGLVRLAAPGGSERSDVGATALASGGFVLTWTEHDPKSGDGSGTSIGAQVFAVLDEQAGKDDTFSIREDQALAVHWKELLENDGLSPTGAVSVDRVDAVTHGVVEIDADGFIHFVPDADFNGIASFTYHLKGDDGFTATATVHIVVDPVNDAPVARDDSGTVEEDVMVTGSVASNDSDLDSADLRYALIAPVAGLSIDADGSFAFDASDAAYQHLGVGETEAVVATYQLADDAGETVTATLTITVTGRNDAPIGLSFKGAGLAENAPGGTAVGIAFAQDVDGDALVFALTDDAAGRFVIDARTGAITVAADARLDYDTERTIHLAVTATDGHGESIAQGIVISLTDLLETISGTDDADHIRAFGPGSWRLEGLGGDDILTDGHGAATLVGGTGSDNFNVRNGATIVVELSDEGVDTIVTTLADFTLSDGVERLRAIGSGAFTGVGNALANVVRGGLGDDTLSGADGDDLLFGGVGADRLTGDVGADVLVGGAGSDVMAGGSEADRFRYLSIDDSNPIDGADRIVDFAQAEGDRIDLVRIDAIDGVTGSRFTFIADAAFGNRAGELRFEHDGNTTIIFGDVDGDGVADLSIILDGTIILAKTDFIL